MNAAIAALDATAIDGGWGIPVGTPVYDLRGEKIGTVVDADPYELVVERGLFLVRHYPVKLSDVDRFEDGKLYLKRTKEQVLDGAAG